MAPTPIVSPSNLPVATTPAPVAFACSSQIPSGSTLALATLRGSTDVVVRDITDLSKPLTRCAFKSCSQWCESYGPDFARFVTGSRISYIVRSGDGAGAMYLADLATQKTALVRKWSAADNYFWVFAWSPDGNSLTYFTSDQWLIRTATGDVALSPLGKDLGYNFNRNSDSQMVGFSADGQYAAVDQSIDLGTKQVDGGYGIQKGALFKVVRLSDKKVVYSRSDGTMAAWAGVGAHLYFRTSSGLEEWDPINGRQLVVGGLAWTNPVPSADGKRIAFLATDANGHHFASELRLTDQPLRPITLSSLPRAGIAFLNPTVVWYAEEAACNQSPCRCDDAICEPFLTGRTYVHDLMTGTISASVLTAIADTWPRPGS